MVMECNIDARGKAIRLFGGMASIVAGFGVASVAYFGLVEFPYLWYASAGPVSYTHLTLPTIYSV